MDSQEKEIIEDLFRKIGDVAARTGDRDREAEDLIRERMAEQPSAAYYMAQTIVMQEVALHLAQERLEGRRPDTNEPAAKSGFSTLLASHWDRLRNVLGFGRWRTALRGLRSGRRGFLSSATDTAISVAGGAALGEIVASALARSDVPQPDPVAAGGEISELESESGEDQDTGGEALFDLEAD